MLEDDDERADHLRAMIESENQRFKELSEIHAKRIADLESQLATLD